MQSNRRRAHRREMMTYVASMMMLLAWTWTADLAIRRTTTSTTFVQALSSPNPSSSSSITPSLYGSTTRNIATQVLQGTGPPQVDLNRYNLPYDDILDEWTVENVQKVTESRGRVQLTARSTKEHYVDTLLVSFPRSADKGGLGLQLLELAGGRDDGIGITIINGIIEGGNADGSDLLPGDSIDSISLVRRKRRKTTASEVGSTKTSTTIRDVDDKDNDNPWRLDETEEAFSISILCLDYEKTVELISSLPPPLQVEDGVNYYEDTFTLKVRRIRRRPKVRVQLQFPPGQEDAPPVGQRTIEMYAGENLRQGMLIRGVALNDPLAQRFDTKQGGNCGAGGLCRTCSVVIQNGAELLNPQRPAEKQMLADQPRWRLACKAIIGYGMQEGEMTIRVNPRQWS